MTRATSAIRVLPAPETEPPYEDSHEDERVPAGGGTNHEDSTTAPRGVQGTLALSFSLPSGAPATPQPPAGLRLVQSQPERADVSDPVRADPAVRPWACKFVQAVVEVLAGARPASQLLRWTSPEVYERVRRRAGVPGGWPPESRGSGRPRVHSVRLCQPNGDVTEVCAVVRGGGRARAIALRLEATGRHWRCIDLELG